LSCCSGCRRGGAQAVDGGREAIGGRQRVGLEGIIQRLLVSGHVDGMAEADEGDFNAFGTALKADHATHAALPTMALASILALAHIALALKLFLGSRCGGCGSLGE